MLQSPGQTGLPGVNGSKDDHRRGESLKGSADFHEAGKLDRVVCRICHQVVEVSRERPERIQLKCRVVPTA